MTTIVPSKEINEALARGYCNPVNQHKVLDPELIKAMAIEVKSLIESEKRKAVVGFIEKQISIMISYRSPDNPNYHLSVMGKVMKAYEQALEEMGVKS
jgi:hypothetical protein